MCLSGAAHGVDREHAIFQGPFPVALEFQDEPTPSSYSKYYAGRGLGGSMPTWRVHDKDYVNTSGYTPGVVADGGGWEDSPDAEVISGGMNTKGPNAVALGRQGPLFHWGFYAEPQDMTPSGRAAFLNAVVYTAGFDRTPLLVRKEARARGNMLDRAYRLSILRESWQESLQRVDDFNARVAAARAKREAGEPMPPQEQQYADFEPWTKTAWEDYRDEALAPFAESGLLETLGSARPEAFLEYYEENLGYLVPVEGDAWMWTVDVDALAYGIANHDLALLDAALADLDAADAEQAARGRRVLERYTGLSLPTPAAWSGWLGEARPRLYFSDVGGYRWFVAPLGESAHGG